MNGLMRTTTRTNCKIVSAAVVAATVAADVKDGAGDSCRSEGGHGVVEAVLFL